MDNHSGDDFNSDLSSSLDGIPLKSSLDPQSKKSQELFKLPKRNLLNFSALTNSTKSVNFKDNLVDSKNDVPAKSSSVFELSRLMNQRQQQFEEQQQKYNSKESIGEQETTPIDSSAFDISSENKTEEATHETNTSISPIKTNNNPSIIHQRITTDSLLTNIIHNNQENNNTKASNTTVSNPITTSTNNNDDIWDAFEATPLPQRSPKGNRDEQSHIQISDRSLQTNEATKSTSILNKTPKPYNGIPKIPQSRSILSLKNTPPQQTSVFLQKPTQISQHISQLPQVDTTTIFLSSQDSVPRSQSREQIGTSSSYASLNEFNPVTDSNLVIDSNQAVDISHTEDSNKGVIDSLPTDSNQIQTNDFVSLEQKSDDQKKPTSTASEQTKQFEDNRISSFSDTNHEIDSIDDKNEKKTSKTTSLSSKAIKNQNTPQQQKVSSEETEVKLKSSESEQPETEQNRGSRIIGHLSSRLSSDFDNISSNFKRLFFNELSVMLKRPVEYPIPSFDEFKDALKHDIDDLIIFPVQPSTKADRIKDTTMQILEDNLPSIKNSMITTLKQQKEKREKQEAKFEKFQQKIKQLSSKYKDISQKTITRLSDYQKAEEIRQMSDNDKMLYLSKTLSDLKLKEMELESKEKDITNEFEIVERSLLDLEETKRDFYYDFFSNNFFGSAEEQKRSSCFNIRSGLLNIEGQVDDYLKNGFLVQSRSLEKALIKEIKESEKELAYLVEVNSRHFSRKVKPIE